MNGTYWENFIILYKKEIENKTLETILEAFYYYCQSNSPICEKSDVIMGRIKNDLPYSL
jgi:hypothetical protein